MVISGWELRDYSELSVWNFALQMALNPNREGNVKGEGGGKWNWESEQLAAWTALEAEHGHWLCAVLRRRLKALYERLRLIYVNDLPHFALHNKWWSAEGHGRERARPREARTSSRRSCKTRKEKQQQQRQQQQLNQETNKKLSKRQQKR